VSISIYLQCLGPKCFTRVFCFCCVAILVATSFLLVPYLAGIKELLPAELADGAMYIIIAALACLCGVCYLQARRSVRPPPVYNDAPAPELAASKV